MLRRYPAWPAAAVALASLTAGCAETPPAAPVSGQVVDTIVITPSSWTATRVGQRQPFSAAALDARGLPVPGTTITFSSSDSTVVSIDAHGLATARSEGAATLRAHAGGDTTRAPLAVDPVVRTQDSVLYTVFVALADSSPVMLYGGALHFSQSTYGTRFPLASPWEGPSVIGRFAWGGDHYAVMTDVADGRGTVWIKDRISEWALVAVGDAVDVQAERARFAWLLADGRLRVKENPSDPVTEVASGVRSFQLTGSRIGALQPDSVLRVKEGTIQAPWVDVSSSVVRFQMRGGLIAVVQPGGQLRAKAGVNDSWTVLADSGVVDFRVSGALIGMITSDGKFQVKEGVSGPWALLATSGVAQFELEGERIAWRLSDGSVRVKDTPFGSVTNIGTDIQDIRLQGDFIGQITTAGELSIKRGINGTRVIVGTYPDLTQYRLFADVPQRPTRTNPSSYEAGRTACHAVQLADFCFSPYEPAVPVPHYGRFCGAGIPTDANLDSARSSGPLDGMDQLCRHHDSAGTWYPNDQGPANACVVMYGLEFARLTRNGSQIALGTTAYDAAFASMPDLRDVTAAYRTWASVCDGNQLDQFIAATASQH